jgi:hypothetical protein
MRRPHVQDKPLVNELTVLLQSLAAAPKGISVFQYRRHRVLCASDQSIFLLDGLDTGCRAGHQDHCHEKKMQARPEPIRRSRSPLAGEAFLRPPGFVGTHLWEAHREIGP